MGRRACCVHQRRTNAAPAHWFRHRQRAYERSIDFGLDSDHAGRFGAEISHQTASRRHGETVRRHASRFEDGGDAAELASLGDYDFTPTPDLDTRFLQEGR
jgi:hypothetical protein